jgi:threonine synthase
VVYASHVWLPFNLPGYATAAYEIFEDLSALPGSVVVPAGHGGLLLGLHRGFEAVRQSGRLGTPPKIIAVQVAACAPLAAMLQYGPHAQAHVVEGDTLAEGVRVAEPLRRQAMLQAIKSTGGRVVTVDEADILPSRDALARRGLYVEPTSALVYDALRQVLPSLRDPVVVILTGSGLKFDPNHLANTRSGGLLEPREHGKPS